MRATVPDDAFRLAAEDGHARVIVAVPDQIPTGEERVVPARRGDEIVPDPGRDLLKISVVERYEGSGRIAVGLVTGMGLGRGAIAGTVAHDHHNVIVVGADDLSLVTAARTVIEAGGGLAAADGQEVLAALPLPVGGLMSTAPVEDLRAGYLRLLEAAHRLGSPLRDPFMAMSFLGLEVIPRLKITDRGLVDVDAFRPVDLWVRPDGP